MTLENSDEGLSPELLEWLGVNQAGSPGVEEYLSDSCGSLSEHVRARKATLGKWALERKRIYLDQRYWIDCEKGCFEPSRYPEAAELYQSLRSLARRGLAFCPFCDPVFEESMKSSPTSRVHLAAIIDELSNSVGLAYSDDLARLEITHWLRSTLSRSGGSYPVEQLVWVCPGDILGTLIPEGFLLDQATTLALQKSWYDHFARIPFSVMMAQLAFGVAWPDHDYSEYAKQATADQRDHRSEFNTFGEALEIELAGGLENYSEMLADVLLSLLGHSESEAQQLTGKDRAELGRQLSNVVRIGIKLGRIRHELPFAHIPAGLHALARYRREGVHKGDILDFTHARTALPYCDYFLTEKRLGHLLTDKALEFDRIYSCKVLWKTDEILAELSKLATSD